MKYRRRRPLALGIGVGSLALVIGFFILPLKSPWPGDYYGFWATGQLATSPGISNIYGSDSRRIAAAARAGADGAPSGMDREMRRFYSELDLTASPFHYAVYRLMSSGLLEPDYNRTRLLGFALYVGGIVALSVYLKFPVWSYGLIVWAFTMPFYPFRRDVYDQNGSAGVAGATMLALCLLRWRHPAGRVAVGAALAILAAFKPTVLYAPAFVFLYFALNEWKAMAWFSLGGLLGGVAAFVTPSLVFGPVCSWHEWLQHASSRAFQVRASAGGLLGKYLQVETVLPYKIVTAVFLAGCAAALYRISRRPRPVGSDNSPFRLQGLEAISAGAIGLNVYLLTGILVWGHYFTLAVPSALIAMRPDLNSREEIRPMRYIGFVAALAIGLQHHLQAWGWTTSGSYSIYTLTGTLALIVILFRDMNEERARRPAD